MCEIEAVKSGIEFTLFISNEGMNDIIIKIIKSLEDLMHYLMVFQKQ